MRYPKIKSRWGAGLLFWFMLTAIHPISLCLGADLQRIEIPSSFNPVGSGARALGMSGAFIAVADDATAASWNPGGLIQLQMPEISVVYDGFHRTEANRFVRSPAASGDESVTRGRINYLSGAYPFSLLGKDMIVSLNYQRLYDFTRKWDFPLVTDEKGLFLEQRVDYKQEGDLSAVGMAWSIQATSALSFGVTLNLWDDDLSPNGWKSVTVQQGSGRDAGDAFNVQSIIYDRYSFKGMNANIGMLWIVDRKLTVGAVLKTPFEADLSHTRRGAVSVQYPGAPEFSYAASENSSADETLKMPLSFGIGAAYRFFHNLTLSLDLYRTEWDDFVRVDAHGSKWSPITGEALSDADIDPTHQIRMGMEYLWITRQRQIIPLCAGFFYDPAPAPGSPDDIFGFSLGSGIGYGIFHFDVAYQYRFGEDMGEYMMEAAGFSQNLKEHTLYASMVVHF